MRRSTRQILLIATVIVIAGVAIWYFMKDQKKNVQIREDHNVVIPPSVQSAADIELIDTADVSGATVQQAPEASGGDIELIS